MSDLLNVHTKIRRIGVQNLSKNPKRTCTIIRNTRVFFTLKFIFEEKSCLQSLFTSETSEKIVCKPTFSSQNFSLERFFFIICRT